jgi:uncharacterized protein
MTIDSCHNSSDKVGDIYMPYLDYMRKIIKTDVTKSRDYLCGDCDIEIMCDRACYQISDDELQNGSFCKLKRALYKPIIELVMSFMMDGDNCDNK